jgi:PAS domain S-box-containing protein
VRKKEVTLFSTQGGTLIISNEEKFKLFIENTDIGIFSFNMKDKYKEINSKFCGMIGYDRDELYEYNFPEPFWTKNFFSEAINDIEAYKKTGLLNLKTYFCRKNKSYFPVHLCGSIIPKSGSEGLEYLILLDDITEQKKAEREFKLTQEMLITLNKKLEEMVKKRTKQLKLVMKQKNEFINQLSHDLKNPLNPIINLIPVLQEKTLDNELKDVLSILMENVNYMHDLIINTIEIAKLDSLDIHLSFEPINLKKEIEFIINTNFKLNNPKNISISSQVDEDIWLDVDKLRFHELIINIINNAIKFGVEKGSVFVLGEKYDDKSTQIKIIDDGIGMTENQLQNAFDKFYRVNYKNSISESSGLGLNICKRIVENHDGQIHCESQGLGKGTTVVCILPFKHDSLDDPEVVNQSMLDTINSK